VTPARDRPAECCPVSCLPARGAFGSAIFKLAPLQEKAVPHKPLRVLPRWGGRERRVSDVADAVAALDHNNQPYAVSRARLRSALLPVADALPVCHALARTDQQIVEDWIVKEDTRRTWSSQNANLIARSVMRAAERELEAAFLKPPCALRCAGDELRSAPSTLRWSRCGDFCSARHRKPIHARSKSDAFLDEAADFLVPREA
jgi:hypothetical protein